MIKFLDLKRVNDSYDPELSDAIKKVLDSGWYLLGEQIDSFEKEYARFIGTDYCVGVASGLDALRIILRGYMQIGRLKEGDKVIVPANTFIATILAITDCRLIPVFVEPDLNSFNLNTAFLEKSITSSTKAILLVHLYGQNAMNAEIERIVRNNGLLLIEDNAQAHGCKYRDRRTGSLGVAAA